MAKKVRTVRSTKTARVATTFPSLTQEAVDRLEHLARELDTANKEATAVADLVRPDLANELSRHFADSTPKK